MASECWLPVRFGRGGCSSVALTCCERFGCGGNVVGSANRRRCLRPASLLECFFSFEQGTTPNSLCGYRRILFVVVQRIMGRGMGVGVLEHVTCCDFSSCKLLAERPDGTRVEEIFSTCNKNAHKTLIEGEITRAFCRQRRALVASCSGEQLFHKNYHVQENSAKNGIDLFSFKEEKENPRIYERYKVVQV